MAGNFSGLLVSSLVAAFQWLAGIVMIGGLALMVMFYAICSLCQNFHRTVDGTLGRLVQLKPPASISELVDGRRQGISLAVSQPVRRK